MIIAREGWPCEYLRLYTLLSNLQAVPTAGKIPGRIESEDFDVGGQGTTSSLYTTAVVFFPAVTQSHRLERVSHPNKSANARSLPHVSTPDAMFITAYGFAVISLAVSAMQVCPTMMTALLTSTVLHLTSKGMQLMWASAQCATLTPMLGSLLVSSTLESGWSTPSRYAAAKLYTTCVQMLLLLLLLARLTRATAHHGNEKLRLNHVLIRELALKLCLNTGDCYGQLHTSNQAG